MPSRSPPASNNSYATAVDAGLPYGGRRGASQPHPRPPRLAARRRDPYDYGRLAVPQEIDVKHWFARLGAAAGAGLLLLPAGSQGQRVGIFFDSQATVCSAPILPLGPSVHAYLFAFIPRDSVVSGVLLRVQFPSQIVVHEQSLVFPRSGIVFEAQGDLAGGLALRFRDCDSTAGPIQLAEFDLDDRSFGGPRSNLRLHCEGFGVDSTATTDPQLRVCNPADPTGSDLRRFAAPSVDAVLNCGQQCGCTTAVVAQAWSAIKALYREP